MTPDFIHKLLMSICVDHSLRPDDYSIEQVETCDRWRITFGSRVKIEVGGDYVNKVEYDSKSD